MKICAAQIKSVKGDIQTNIEQHKKIINLAISAGAEAIFFPELSLTGYEPTLAKELAAKENDTRFNIFQAISDANKIIIAVGLPLKRDTGICISMLIFQPGEERQVYSKKYLHADEEPFFISGINTSVLTGADNNIGLAICYELSVPAHAQNAAAQKATVYMACVAKTAAGADKANERLAAIANEYGMWVLMSNCTGHCDNFESAGHSAVWDTKGELLAQLSASAEGILLLDTKSGKTFVQTI